MQISKSEFLCLVLISLALCLFVSVIPLCTYIVHSAGTKVELHTLQLSNDKVKCPVFYSQRIFIINGKNSIELFINIKFFLIINVGEFRP